MSLNVCGEVDPVLRTAVKVLNSSTQSAEKIRIILDDLIKVRAIQRGHSWTVLGEAHRSVSGEPAYPRESLYYSLNTLKI